jgi:hypothetical protein
MAVWGVEAMQLPCRHCGTTNDIGPFDVDATCRACRKPLLGDDEPGGRTRADLLDLSDLGPPPPGGLPIEPVAAEVFGASQKTPLGELSAVTDEHYDLSAILDPVGVPGERRGSSSGSVDEGPGFAFDDGLANLTRPDMAMPGERAGRAEDLAAPASAGSGGWRVRSERGLVYELMTVDAVIAWLEGKDDLEAVRVARGSGPFVPVREIPELARRLGLGNAPAAKADESPLVLDEGPQKRRPAPTTKGPAAQPPRPGRAPSREVGAQARGARPREAASAPKRDASPALGLGLVLWLLLAAGLVCGGAVAAGLQTGFLGLPPPAEPPAPPSAGSADERVQTAQRMLEAGQNTGAERLLRQAAQAPDAEPRVLKSWALALHRTGNDAEARDTLAEYRRRMARMGR